MELVILDWIQSSLRCGILDRVMTVVTGLGDGGWIWISLTVLLLLFPGTRKTGMAMALSLVLELLLCNVILKPLVARVRPFDVNTAIQLLVAPPSDDSFPSGHTAASFAAASALYFSKSRLWIPAAVLAVLIAFSRLYLYVHYPTDVLAGALLGILMGRIGTALLP